MNWGSNVTLDYQCFWSSILAKKKRIKEYTLLPQNLGLCGTHTKITPMFYHNPNQRTIGLDKHCFFSTFSQNDTSLRILGIEFSQLQKNRKFRNMWILELHGGIFCLLRNLNLKGDLQWKNEGIIHSYIIFNKFRLVQGRTKSHCAGGIYYVSFVPVELYSSLRFVRCIALIKLNYSVRYFGSSTNIYKENEAKPSRIKA